MSDSKTDEKKKGVPDGKEEKGGWEECKGGFAARVHGGALEFRFGSDEQASAVANRFKQVINEQAYIDFINSNPNAYNERSWVVFAEGRQLRHLEATIGGREVSRDEAMRDAPPGAFCTRFSRQHLTPTIRSLHIPQ